MHFDKKVKGGAKCKKTLHKHIFTKNVKLYKLNDYMYNKDTDKKDLAEARSSIPLMEYNAFTF